MTVATTPPLLRVTTGLRTVAQARPVGLVAVLVVAAIIGALKLGQVVYYWDESFIIYDAWRLYLGEIPNSQYVSGYMGAQSLLLAAMFDVFGATFDTYHATMFVYWLIYVAAVFAVARQLVSQQWAIIASLSSALGYLQWWYLNPGLSVEILAVLALGSFFLWQRRRHRRFLILAGALCGIALSFKQSGLFIGVAGLNVIAIIHLLGGPSRLWHRMLIAFLPAITFFGYVTLRLSGQSLAPLLNYAVLIPWLSIFFILMALVARNGDKKHSLLPYLADCTAFGGASLTAIAPLIIWYRANGLAPAELINETFVRVPALVDRGVAPLGFPDAWMMLMIVVSIAPLYLRFFTRRRTAFAAGVFLLCFVIFVHYKGLPNAFDFIDGVYERLWRGFLWWGIFLTPLVLASSVLMTRKRLGLSSDEVARLCILFVFGGTFLAITFPWPTHMYVVAIISLMMTTLNFLFLKARFRIRAFSKQTASPWTIGAVCCVLVAILFDYQIRIQKPQYIVRVDEPRLHGWVAQNEAPYVELARAIRRLPQGETVFGYPNLAFSMFLAGRPPQTRYGNFLGRKADFDLLVKEIGDSKIDWIVVSPTDYGSLFYSQADLAPRGLPQALALSYEKAFTSGQWDFYKRVSN